MQLTATIAPAAPTAAPSARTNQGNPWGFPTLDRAVAQRAYDGMKAGVDIVNRLIDRSIEVRVMLDRDLKANSFGQDTLRAVHLLTRARDHAMGTLDDRHLSPAVLDPIEAWIRTSKDERIRIVNSQTYGIQGAVRNLLDDEEGNVHDAIVSMRTNPGRNSWQAVRDSLDGAIGSLYGAREVYDTLHVLSAAGGLR